MRYYSLVLVILLQLTVRANMKTSTAIILDSVYTYLDSVPEIRDSVFAQLQEWKHNPREVNFYPDEYKELRIHLKYSVISDYKFRDRVERTLSLLNHKLTEEVNQFLSQKKSIDDIKHVYSRIKDSCTYPNAKVLDAHWADSDKLLVLIGQTHSFNYSEEENKLVSLIQNEIFSLQENLLRNGIDLLLQEGFFDREIDWDIPTKLPRADIYKNIDHRMLYKFDSLYNCTCYGFENNCLFAKADSLMKVALFFNLFVSQDSSLFPLSQSNFEKYILLNAQKNIAEYPHYDRNFDADRLIDSVHAIFPDSIIDYTLAREKSTMLTQFAQEIIINQRNESAVACAENVFEYTNKQMAILKIGAGHLDPRVSDIAKMGFCDRLITVQDFCKKENISYVHIVTKSQYEQLKF